MNRREMLAGVVALPFIPSMLLKNPPTPNVQIMVFDGKKAIPAKVTHCPKKCLGEVRGTVTTPGTFDRMELVLQFPDWPLGGVRATASLPHIRLEKGNTLNLAWKIVLA